MENENTNWKLCVRCYTYNQEAYILDALNGFVMQQTDFPFVCCIVDDASTDGEQDIIKNFVFKNFDLGDDEKSFVNNLDYGTVIYARHKHNQNCYFLVLLLKENHNGSLERKIKKRSYISKWEMSCKYEALCEGDDYWIDPQKIQKQVSFLESNPNYSLCFHNSIQKWEDRSQKSNLFSNVEDRDYDGTEFFKHWIIPTASTVFRTEIYNNTFYKTALKNKKIVFGDTRLFCSLSKIGRVRGMSDVMSVYRRNMQSMTFVQSISYERRLQLAEMYLAFGEQFGGKYIQIGKKLFVQENLTIFLNSIHTTGKKIFWEGLFNCFRISLSKTICSFVDIIRTKI